MENLNCPSFAPKRKKPATFNLNKNLINFDLSKEEKVNSEEFQKIKIAALVIAIGDIPYKKASLEVLSDFFNYNEIELNVIENDIAQNTLAAHPSWLKMFAHSLVDADFILCWDLDLIPVERYKISEFVKDIDKIHIGVETAYFHGYQNNSDWPWFQYNCGLMGWPKSFKKDMEEIYTKSFSEYLPMWEQLPVNRYLSYNNIDIELIRPQYNSSISPNFQFLKNTRNAHVTYGINDPWEKKLKIEHLSKQYFDKI